MPLKCCVPGCRSNYSGETCQYVSGETCQYVSVFSFPSDLDLKEKWIQSIGRKDYTVSEYSVVCAKHFQPDCVVTADCTRRDDGTLLCVPRAKPKLIDGAIPTIFPHHPPSSTRLLKQIKAESGKQDKQKIGKLDKQGRGKHDKQESEKQEKGKHDKQEKGKHDKQEKGKHDKQEKGNHDKQGKGKRCKQESEKQENHESEVANRSTVIKDRTNVIKGRSSVIKDQSDVIKDRSSVFKDHSDVIKDQSDVIKGRSDVIKDHSYVIKDHSYVIKDHSYVIKDPSCVIKDRSYTIKNSITSFQSLCQEINSHIRHQNFTSDVSITTQNATRSQEQRLVQNADHWEATHIKFKLKFLEQQRKYMHTFTDHYIDRMITDGKSWTRDRLVGRPGFADVCQSLDKAVEFLCHMCEELLRMVAADNKDGKSTQPKDCPTSLEFPDSIPGDVSTPVTSTTLNLGQPLKSGPAAGMYSWYGDHCSSVFSQNGVSNKHITETRDISSSKKSEVSDEYDDNTCAEYSDHLVVKGDCHQANESHKLEQMSEESPLVVTESCGTQTGCEISSPNDDGNQEQTPSHTVNKCYNSDGFNSHFLNLGQQQIHKQSFTSRVNISRLTGASPETKNTNCDTLMGDKLHSENRNFNDSLHEANCADEISLINNCRTAHSDNSVHICTVEEPYTCAICNAGFKTIVGLRSHMAEHPGMKPFHCEVCGAGFSSKTQTKIHMRKHTGEKPYVCEDCGAKFAIRRQLNVHRVLHTGVKPYKCDVCGVGFNQAFALQLHKRKHTGEKPYKCDVCGTGFNQAFALQVHKRKHTVDKPYYQQRDHLVVCEICGLKLSGITSLQYHKRRHTGAKPHKCDV